MAEIISTVEEAEGKCVIILNADELDALEDVLVGWTNHYYRHNHDKKWAQYIRYTLNDVFLGVVGWNHIDPPQEEMEPPVGSIAECDGCGARFHKLVEESPSWLGEGGGPWHTWEELKRHSSCGTYRVVYDRRSDK